MNKKCKRCGACQECGQVQPTVYPQPIYQWPYPTVYPFPSTGYPSPYTVTWSTHTSGAYA